MAPGHSRVVLTLIRVVVKISPAIDDLLRRTAADSELEPAGSDQVRSAGVLRHVMRILIAHVDDRGADFNLSCFSADRRKQRKRRRQLAREMMNAEVGSIHSQALSLDGEIDGLEESISRRARFRLRRRCPMTEGEEADLLHTIQIRILTPGCGDFSTTPAKGRGEGRGSSKVNRARYQPIWRIRSRMSAL